MANTSFDTVYNELSHTIGPQHTMNGLDPMYKWDTHFPERMSRLNINPEFSSPVARRSRKGRPRNSARFKTQPITFDEIKEVDEEPSVVEIANNNSSCCCKTKEGLKSQFTAFSRTMDGLMPSLNYALKKSPESGIKPLKADSKTDDTPLVQPELRSAPKYGDTVSATEIKQTPAPPSGEAIRTINPELLPAHLLSDNSRNRRQKRFKKNQRHNRSIEEAPELDKGVEAEHAVR